MSHLTAKFDVIANNVLERKLSWMVCEACATKLGLSLQWQNSTFRCLLYEDEPGCGTCGKKTHLNEIFEYQDIVNSRFKRR